MKNQTVLMTLIVIFIVIALSGLGAFSFSVVPDSYSFSESNDVIEDGSDLPKERTSIFIGNEEISFEGLRYDGPEGHTASFKISEPGFSNVVTFRDVDYTLEPGDNIIFEHFTLTYLPFFRSFDNDQIRGDKFVSAYEYTDRIMVEFSMDGLGVSFSDDAPEAKLGEDIILLARMDNQLFDGIRAGIDVKTSDLTFFRQGVTSSDKELDLGIDIFSYVIPNEAFGEKTVEVTKTVEINGRTYAQNQFNTFRFVTDRDGVTKLVADDFSYTIPVEEELDSLPVIEDLDEDVQMAGGPNYLFIFGIAGLLITGIIMFVRRK